MVAMSIPAVRWPSCGEAGSEEKEGGNDEPDAKQTHVGDRPRKLLGPGDPRRQRPAKAQTCPTGTAIPLQTIKIFNDTSEYVFAEFEVGLNNPDQWIQMACNITQTQANHGLNYPTTLTNRFYINGLTGIRQVGAS